MDEHEPTLETGHEPGTPIGDSLLRRFLFNWAEAIAALAESMGGRRLRRDDFWAADVGRPAGYANTAILLRPLSPHRLEATLAALADFYGFGRRGVGGECAIFSAWPTPDLRPHGWHLVGHPPLHVLPALSGGETPPAPPPELRVEAVGNASGLRVFEETIVAGYPFPELVELGAGAMIGKAALADPRLRLFVGWVDDQPVGAAGAFVDHGVNDVLIVATRRSARRRGYGEALTWRAAHAEPGFPAMLLSSDLGRPVYERMGFLPLFRTTLWYRERRG
jgi:hypothetical protein